MKYLTLLPVLVLLVCLFPRHLSASVVEHGAFTMPSLEIIGRIEETTHTPISEGLNRNVDPKTALHTCEPYRPLFAMYDWNVNTMLRICNAESHGNPLAKNDNPRTGDYSIGLTQVNLYGRLALSRPSEAELKIPEKNIAFAYTIWKSSGYHAWTTF